MNAEYIPYDRCNILGVDVGVTSLDKTLSTITADLVNLKGHYICVSNVHTIVMSYDDRHYREIQNTGFMVLPDGKPLSIVSRLRGHKNARRVTGPDLMGSIFNISERNGYRHFFYGSTNDTLEMLKSELVKRYPSLDIAGMFSPPFRELTKLEDNEIVDMINKTRPDFIWVGLGAPKQEYWMSRNRGKLKGLMIGVGAGFDYFAGNINRAPLWMQKMSLEWLFRLIQEPQRLWKRYLVYNTRFLILVIKESLKSRYNI